MAAAAALVFAAFTALVVGFQLALALGAPWGAYAMGGAFPGRLPKPIRAAALAQAIVLAGLALVVLLAGGVIGTGLPAGWTWVAWVPVGIAVLAVIGNAVTRSAGERRLWLPVAAVMLVASLLVALG